MESTTLAEAAKTMGGRVIGESAGRVRFVCTDTREGTKDSLFFALHGENSDGHRFVRQALDAGAAAAVVDHEVLDAGGPQIVVPNTLTALGDLARGYRSQFEIPVIGVTGSVGKTSTREMIGQALTARFNVHTSVKNFNNEIGLPHTIFRLNPSHQALVVEMGMRGIGQIAELASIARPNIGVVTNIGLSHIELLGSREAVAAAKSELLDALPESGAAIVNSDDDFTDFLISRSPCRVLTFGVKQPADFRAEAVRFSSQGYPRFTIRNVEFEIDAPGVHHIVNAAAACAVGEALEVPLREMAAKLADFQPPAMRMEVLEVPTGVTVLNDAYNAAPDSMRAALETLDMMATGRRKVAILGEMRELGEFGPEAHRYVGRLVAEHGVDLLITVGAAAEAIAQEATLPTVRAWSYESTEEAVKHSGGLLLAGDLILVKGSRAMKMEQIVETIRGWNG